jgi:hypothetical protein
VTIAQLQTTRGPRAINTGEDPDLCPICHNGIQPVYQKLVSLRAGENLAELVWKCPLHLCGCLFIGVYLRNPVSGTYHLHHCVPTELEDYSPPEDLEKISPDFCAIFNEAQKAEQLGYLLVSGPGYRKALEFLVKDYLTSLQTSDDAKKEIAEMPLMACIKKYVTDTRMRTTAERATWLGNDQTHYIRKWEDKDLQDMKKLIQLTCFWIQSEHLTNAAAAEMPQGKK